MEAASDAPHVMVASGSDGGVVAVTKDERTRNFPIHQGRVSALEGRAGKFISVGVDGRVYVFGPDGEVARTVDVGAVLFGVALSGDGRSVWVYGPEVRRIIDVGVEFGNMTNSLEEQADEGAQKEAEEQVETSVEEVDQTMKMLYGDF
jgi:hypothetical protein